MCHLSLRPAICAAGCEIPTSPTSPSVSPYQAARYPSPVNPAPPAHQTSALQAVYSYRPSLYLQLIFCARFLSRHQDARKHHQVYQIAAIAVSPSFRQRPRHREYCRLSRLSNSSNQGIDQFESCSALQIPPRRIYQCLTRLFLARTKTYYCPKFAAHLNRL